MGDEDKINLTETAKEAFLRDAARIEGEKPKLYNLVEEFERTRSNRSLRTILLVAGFIIFSAGLAVFLTVYVENQNRKITIDIADFEDVSLKDLLNASKKNENDLAQAKQGLADIRQEQSARSAAINQEFDGKLAVLTAQGLPNAEKDSRTRALKDEQKKQQAALAASYAPKIAAAQAAVNEVQKRMDAYDQRQLETAKKQEEVLNNQQRLHDLQLDQTKSYYEAKIKEQTAQYTAEIRALKTNQESVRKTMTAKNAKDIAALILKFNPVFETKELKSILSSPLEEVPPSSFPRLQAELGKARYVPQEILSRIADQRAARAALGGRLSKIPYVNSIPSALTHSDYADRVIMRSYDEMAFRLLQEIRADEDALAAAAASIKQKEARIGQLQSTVEQYQLAFEARARQTGQNGYLLDVRDTARLAVIVNPGYTIANEDQGLVFRKDDEFIGTIRFVVTPDGVSAVLVELAAGKTLEPFDVFLIKRK